MSKLSTKQVAKKLGLTGASLSRYIKAGKITAPPETMAGGIKLRLWSESDIEKLRQLLPKIANGRKTRYQKLREKQKPQPRAPQPQHAKTARTGGPSAVPHKSRKKKKTE
jgi:predicted DNA-binding transcriptional regulator AlpA